LKNKDGSTAVEFALISIPLLLFIFGLFSLCNLYYVNSSLERTADELSRYTMMKYSSGNVSLSVYQKNAKQWLTDNYHYDDPGSVRLTVQSGVVNGIPYREFKLSRSVGIFIPAFNYSIDVEARRQVPY
jgi:Flp pilus assembly protein TadG